MSGGVQCHHRIVHGARFRKLQDQAFGFHPGVAAACRDAGDEAEIATRTCGFIEEGAPRGRPAGKIHGNRQVRSREPLRVPFQRRVQDLVGQFVDQPVSFGAGDELVGQDDPTRRVRPAHQSFESRDSTRAAVNLRLKDQRQFTIVERMPQFPGDRFR
jgi:hypothetical protein